MHNHSRLDRASQGFISHSYEMESLARILSLFYEKPLTAAYVNYREMAKLNG